MRSLMRQERPGMALCGKTEETKVTCEMVTHFGVTLILELFRFKAEQSHTLASYPATRREALSGFRGIRAWILVPWLSCESIAIVPLTSLTRSSMLARPTPLPCLAAPISKPLPV